jgi:hypothetical protein
MQKDSGLKSKLHQNLRKFKKIRLLQRKLMKLVAKPHHLHTIEREKGAQPQRVPNVPNVSLVRCGMRECHKGSMRKCHKGFMTKNHTWDKKKWNILILACYSHKTPNPLLFTFWLETPILLPPYSCASHSMFSLST